MSDSDCFICKKTLGEGEVQHVSKRGVDTLLAASIARGHAENGRMLRTLESITVHRACQKNYADTRWGINTVCSPSLPSIVEPTFDFKNLCFLCAELANEDFLKTQTKLPYSRRKQVSLVTMNTLNNTLKYLSCREDEDAHNVLARIENLDLSVRGARYHAECYKMVLQPSTGKKPGKPLSNDVTSAMEDIYAYLEQNAGECQFTLKQLMDKIEGDYKPSYSTVKQRLKEKYHHDVFIFEKVGTQSILKYDFRNFVIKIVFTFLSYNLFSLDSHL